MCCHDGKALFCASARSRIPKPEPKPLSVTICIGSRSAMRRVQLFSRPQQRVAPRTKSEPREKRNASRTEFVSTDSKRLATVTRPIAIHKRRRSARHALNAGVTKAGQPRANRIPGASSRCSGRSGLRRGGVIIV